MQDPPFDSTAYIDAAIAAGEQPTTALRELGRDWNWDEGVLDGTASSGRLYFTNFDYDPAATSPFDDPTCDRDEAANRWARERQHHSEQRCMIWLLDPDEEGYYSHVVMAGLNWGLIDEDTWDEVEWYIRCVLDDRVRAYSTLFSITR